MSAPKPPPSIVPQQREPKTGQFKSKPGQSGSFKQGIGSPQNMPSNLPGMTTP